jgi:hypothetical protein
MNDDEIFRLILIVGLVAVLPVAVAHRVKAHWGGEKLDRRQEGLFLLISIRLLGVAGMAGLLAFLIDPSWMVWSSVPLRWAAVGLDDPQAPFYPRLRRESSAAFAHRLEKNGRCSRFCWSTIHRLPA